MFKHTKKILLFIYAFLCVSVYGQNITGTWKAFDRIEINNQNAFHEIVIHIIQNNDKINGTLVDKILGTDKFKKYNIRGNTDGKYIWISTADVITRNKKNNDADFSNLTLKLSLDNDKHLSGLVTQSEVKHNLYFNQGNKIKFNRSMPDISTYPNKKIISKANVFSLKKIEKKNVATKQNTTVKSTETSKNLSNNRVKNKYPKSLQSSKKNLYFDTTHFIDLDKNNSVTSEKSLPYQLNKLKLKAEQVELQKYLYKRKNYVDFVIDVEEDTCFLSVAPNKENQKYDSVSVFINEKLIETFINANPNPMNNVPIYFAKKRKPIVVTLVSLNKKTLSNNNTKVIVKFGGTEYQITLTAFKNINNQIVLKR